MSSDKRLREEWAAVDAAMRRQGRSDGDTPGGDLWRLLASFEAVQERAHRTYFALFLVAFVAAAALIARVGTVAARGLAMLCIAIALAFAWGLAASNELRAKRALLRQFDKASPDQATRFRRAVSLLARSEAAPDGTSAELALVHFERAVSRLPLAAVTKDMGARATRVALIRLVLAAAAVSALVAVRWSLAEGLDVLLARQRVAPVSFAWFDDVAVKVHPPPYLHLDDWVVALPGTVVVPSGSTLLFRGLTQRDPSRLELLAPDGMVPFLDDGHGAVVAEWMCRESADVALGARFGEVVIPDRLRLRVRAMTDTVPRVALDGAPRELHGEGDFSGAGSSGGGIVLLYEASDDHGLSAIDLVLRSGSREERRSLARLDGERSYGGAEVVRLRDPFLKASVSSVEISIEARDNDSVKGPKWGKSAVVTFVPREIGRGEVTRIESLRALRAALVDSLAVRLAAAVPNEPPLLPEFLRQEKQLHSDDLSKMNATFGFRYEGLSVPLSMQRVLRGFADREGAALQKEEEHPTDATHRDVIRANERWIVALDRLIQANGSADARRIAKRLADVADDLVALEDDMAKGRQSDLTPPRLDASETLLSTVAGSMLHLGTLGYDLGEIIAAYLARVTRAEEAHDYESARLAGADLALRLRTPDPSFGSKGGAARKGGEPGGSSGADSAKDPSDEGDDGEAGEGGKGGSGKGAGEQGGDALSSELERLAAEHGGQMAELEEKARAAKQKQADEGPRELLRKHAALVREAAKELPSQGEGSDSWTSKGAAARESAEQMAHALESDSLDEAVGAGRHALAALDESAQVASSARGFGGRREVRLLENAKEALRKELAWAENEAHGEQARAADALRSTMQSQSAAEQRLARKIERLANEANSDGRASRHGASPGESVTDALGEAARAADQASRQLALKELDRGRDSQRDVQRALERARQQLDAEKGEDEGSSSSGSERSRGGVGSDSVPGLDAHKGPDDLRRRVLDGLGKGAAGRMKDAVRRYADGLLR